MKRSFMLMGLLAFVGIAAALIFSTGKAIAGEKGGVTIWEVCSVNRAGMPDGQGEYPDWIEIKNTAQVPVSLAGFTLGDGRKKDRQATLPDITLNPDEYMLLCASGREGWDGQYYHVPFRLSAEGELLLLGAPDGRVVQLIYLPAMGADESYGMTGSGIMEKSRYPTPGQENAMGGNRYQAAAMGWVEGRR